MHPTDCCLYLMCMDDIHHCVRISFFTILSTTGNNNNKESSIAVYFSIIGHDFFKTSEVRIIHYTFIYCGKKTQFTKVVGKGVAFREDLRDDIHSSFSPFSILSLKKVRNFFIKRTPVLLCLISLPCLKLD